MAYYTEERLSGPYLRARRPTINEYFLSSYSVAIYDGCEFGCSYCDGWTHRQRPLNEHVRVFVDLPERLAEELPELDPGDLIGITALSDPYQAAESSYRVTRRALTEIAEAQQPCLLLTKSTAVLEDRVLFERINAQTLGIVMFTLLTIDPYLAQKIEDKAPAPALRLDAIAELKRAGIPVGVALIPVIPYVNDTDLMLSSTVRAVAEAGADFLVWDYLHIPDERHRARITDMLARIGHYPTSYYRDLYRGQARPDPAYCAERDRAITSYCDSFNLPVRAPHSLYAGRLSPANEAALLLKHTAFRDGVQGRGNLARQGRILAELVYRGEATDEHLRQSPLYLTLREILGRKPAA